MELNKLISQYNEDKAISIYDIIEFSGYTGEIPPNINSRNVSEIIYEDGKLDLIIDEDSKPEERESAPYFKHGGFIKRGPNLPGLRIQSFGSDPSGTPAVDNIDRARVEPKDPSAATDALPGGAYQAGIDKYLEAKKAALSDNAQRKGGYSSNSFFVWDFDPKRNLYDDSKPAD